MIIENNKNKIIIKVKSKPVISVSEGEIDNNQLFFDICEAIRDGGYDPVSQIVGYIISEDPTHITNYKNARTLIGKLDRDELLKQIVESYIDKITNEIEAKK